MRFEACCNSIGRYRQWEIEAIKHLQSAGPYYGFSASVKSPYDSTRLNNSPTRAGLRPGMVTDGITKRGNVGTSIPTASKSKYLAIPQGPIHNEDYGLSRQHCQCRRKHLKAHPAAMAVPAKRYQKTFPLRYWLHSALIALLAAKYHFFIRFEE